MGISPIRFEWLLALSYECARLSHTSHRCEQVLRPFARPGEDPDVSLLYNHFVNEH